MDILGLDGSELVGRLWLGELRDVIKVVRARNVGRAFFVKWRTYAEISASSEKVEAAGCYRVNGL